jgi:pyruvate/2-oxoglutarate dehydrogenase complex dihydrolipoamide dehydrogenase (E3) component
MSNSLEYDLVIIGATAAARTAAITAVNLQARVALILPQSASWQAHPQRDFYPYALAQIAKTNRSSHSQLQRPSSYPWQYAYAAIDRLEQQLSTSLLATRGVDTIVGTGEFCRRPYLAFNINQRYLRARAYLIATGSVPDIPLIPGIQTVDYLNIDRLPSLAAREIPLRWVIIGTEAVGVELAQTLAKLGCQVKLIVETSQILPCEDLDFANLIQAQLEADGVQVYLSTTVTNISQQDRDKLVIAEGKSILVDEIFIALPDRPFVESFNLLGVGVEYNDRGISIDRYLRTSHPQIYACGSVCGNVLGGYQSQNLTQYEAKIAVDNALHWRKTKIDYTNYNYLPWAVFTDPPLARVGIKISTATNSTRLNLIVLQKHLKITNNSILHNITSGFCQVVVNPKGQILGAEMVGENAPELIQIFAIAIHQKLKLTDLTAVPCLVPSYTEFINDITQEWHQYQHTRRQQRQSGWHSLRWWK